MSFNRRLADKIMSQTLDSAANLVSGLDLTPIGEDGHLIANKLWKVSGYLKGRSSAQPPEQEE